MLYLLSHDDTRGEAATLAEVEVEAQVVTNIGSL